MRHCKLVTEEKSNVRVFPRLKQGLFVLFPKALASFVLLHPDAVFVFEAGDFLPRVEELVAVDLQAAPWVKAMTIHFQVLRPKKRPYMHANLCRGPGRRYGFCSPANNSSDGILHYFVNVRGYELLTISKCELVLLQPGVVW
jgi:hypothetical protein